MAETATSQALDAAVAVARERAPEWKAALLEELRIPSVSTLAEHRDDCRRNAQWLRTRFDALGFETDLVDVVKGGNPVLRADWMRRPEAPTLTIYGHYDVQPPDPLDEWNSDPFDPVERDGHVIARGCADNKGNHMAALCAAKSWFGAGGPPINLRFLIEGEEEVGGDALPLYLARESAALNTDYVVLWDGAFTIDDHPALVVGLRGMAYTEVEVRGAAHDLHSGAFGGIAPNACDALAQLLAGLHDEHRRVTVPGFYDEVRAPDPAETALWHRPTNAEKSFQALIGTDALTGEEGFGLIERIWTRPTLEINGFNGGFTGEGQKTIVPSRATAKVSMRLVADQDPHAIIERLRVHLTASAPDGTRVEVRALGASPPILMDPKSRLVQAHIAAFREAMGVEAVLIRSGGSIPVASAFAEHVPATMIASGIGHVASGAHGPNEHLSLTNYQGGIEMLVRLMHHLAVGAA